jgi:threonine/homoserine/homoserine lactone efflux protein
MEVYLKHFLIGLAIAMPVGAITVELTKQGLKNEFIHGWAVGLGGMTIDVTLILAMYFGLLRFCTGLAVLQIPLWLVGAGFLAYLGYDSIKNADKAIWAFVPSVTNQESDEPLHDSLGFRYSRNTAIRISPVLPL